MDCGGPADPLAPTVRWSLDGADPLAVLVQTAPSEAWSYAVRIVYRVGDTDGDWREIVPSGAAATNLELPLTLDPTLAALAGSLPVELDLRLEVLDISGNLVDTLLGEPLLLWVSPTGGFADAWLAAEVIDQGGLDPLTGELGPTTELLGADGQPLLITTIVDGEE